MARLPRPEMILIDVDGTLVDSVPDLAYCVNAMRRFLQLPEYSETQVREWVGNGVERLVRRALTGQLNGEPAVELFDQAYPYFLQQYAENTCVRSALYPGVRAGLDAFQQAGFRLGCVTNKAAQFTLPLLKQLGVYDDFKIVVCGDTLPAKKPDPLPLLHAAQQLGVNPAQSLMLGDSISDVKAARAAGFGIVCMSYGYNHGADIRQADPDAVIDRFAQLLELF